MTSYPLLVDIEKVINMKKMLSIAFCLALSMMLTVAFTPSVAFGAASNTVQKSKVLASTMTDEEVDDGEEEADPTYYDVSIKGDIMQSEAHKMLKLVNSGEKLSLKWNAALEQKAIQRAAALAINSESSASLAFYGDNDEEYSCTENDKNAQACFAEFKDSFEDQDVADEDDNTDDEGDVTDDAGTTTDDGDADITEDDNYQSMAAAEFVTASGNHYWIVVLSTDASTDTAYGSNEKNQTVKTSITADDLDISASVTNVDKKKHTSFYPLDLGSSYKITLVNKNPGDGKKVNLACSYIASSNTTAVTVSGNKITAANPGISKLTVSPCSTDVGSATISVAVTPGAPSITESSAGKKAVTISWTSVSGAEGYYIYRSATKSKGYKIVGEAYSADTNTATVKTFKGKAYYYKVGAFVSSGDNNFTGTLSSPVKLTAK